MANGNGNGTGVNPVTDWWKNLAMFLAGVVLTLGGAWFANGASKKDIADAVAVQERLSTLQINTLVSQQAELTQEIRSLREQVAALRVSVDGYPEVTTRHLRKR